MTLALPDGQRVYAVGDVHGMAHLLDRLLDAIDAHQAAAPEALSIEVFLGDYIDRGPDSYGVIERLIEPPRHGRQRICLLGNHEEAMMLALHDTAAMERWMSFGGEATMRSYGIDPHLSHRQPAALQPLLHAALPPAHLRFLESLPRMAELGGLLFVHAGIRPGVAIDDQDPTDLVWIRDPFLDHEGTFPRHVVHGHTPVSRPDRRVFRTNIDTAAVFGGALTCAVLEGDGAEFLSIPADS
ncbi:MAG: metallophosphoesterase family protein [Pseudomonadota bacterium]